MTAMRFVAAAGAAFLIMVVSISCTGRHADGTPNGETVEVEVTPVVPDTATVLSQDTVETSAGVVKEEV